MRLLSTIFYLFFCATTYAQSNGSDPNLEAEKRNKDAYFKGLRSSASRTLETCLRACGHYDKGHAHDGNDPDPCHHTSSKMQCECNCGTQNQSTLNDIDRQQQDWQKTVEQRQKSYENKQLAEQQNKLDLQNKIQQQQKIQSQQQEAAQAKLNQLQQQAIIQQQRYQQTQIELDNAKNVYINAYQAAINSGRKESGAMLDATLAGANEISDAKSSLVYTGVGLGLSLFMHLSEKKAQRQQKELEQQQELERIRLIVGTKYTFIKEALDINKYGFGDLVSKDRYATLLLIPKTFDTEEQNIFFTYPIRIMKYADSTYPLKPEIEKKLLAASNKDIIKDRNVYLLYPIVDLEKFANDFVKKMGSGKVIYLNAGLLNFIKNPFASDDMKNGKSDFWVNPSNKINKPEITTPSKNNFWNN